jgi:hypothetical protein
MNMLLDFSPTLKSTVVAENNNWFNFKEIYISNFRLKFLFYLLRTHMRIIEVKPVYFPAFLDLFQKSFMTWVTGFLLQKCLQLPHRILQVNKQRFISLHT